MAKEEVKVLILGGSSHLGSALFKSLKKTKGIKVKATYYENRPKWAEEGEFHYLNGNAPALDEDITVLVKDSDITFNFMNPRRVDFIDSVLFDTPLLIADLAYQHNSRFINVCGSINSRTSEMQQSKAIERLSNVLSERNIGTSVALPMVLDKNSRLVEIISALSKYKITPMVGDGSNKVRAIHRTDFTAVMTRLALNKLPHGKYDLVGSEAMTIRHLFNVVCKEKGRSKPIFFSIKSTIIEKYRKLLGEVFGVNVSIEDIHSLNYDERVENTCLCRALKLKPLSFDSRVKRGGL